MATPFPRYFVIDGRPVKIVAENDVRAMDPRTGAMLPAELVVGEAVALSRDEFKKRLDALRQPILERFATAPLDWEGTGDNDLPYRVVVDGHELLIRVGEFPVEPLYMLRIDGQDIYEIDDWPSAWSKPV